MDFQVTDLQRRVQETVRTLCKEFDLDYWREKDKTETYPWEFVRKLADGGWLGTIIPEEYGGQGLGVTEAALVLHEVAASGAGTSGASAVHFYMFPPSPIVKHGSEAMKQKYLPSIARGELLMAFGVTEPNAGSDTSRITTKAERRGDKWVINGQKVWTTNAQNAQKILLLTRTSPRDEAHPLDGMTLFFVDLDKSACTVRRIDKLARPAVDSNEVFIHDLEASDDGVVGEVGKGFYHLLDGLNPERIVIAMEAIGMGHFALNRAAQYAKERVVFDRPIGQNQAIAHPLAQSWAQLESAQLLALKAAWLYDQGLSCGKEANAAKYLAAEAGFEACDAALQTLGGFGYAKEFHLERIWREVRLYKIAPISQQMVLNYLSTHVLDLPKSY
ncbi:acyl-CoA/acyl-ACP dehydrogenase [Alicyclobacillus tolerans]|uniref:acyl-CoA dehydrogenase family protein n=1 Tax=Alicyclobacillus tolerans TaxID=90970 RepID=UPI001F3BF189|nr:acyl-CoA dehydrogenase family protein [Alicyclobacillus tolerans]MCF8564223.1 acyl-CoA/acyl-ACP dehydrogenase [Alicyclobacillus tolerans]